ncbi:MAG: prephenate dehydrogenase/arogenate dehydrogenase family protein, partial [Verrucomicrobiae bacterium]|nr:prephenate dehydrogenase/arogenate dehydrogenase family protein [Verrucomicrobiae bacterium]
HISHLPHLLASSLCSFLGRRPEEWRLLSSTGLRDATRIASGDPGLWKAIIETNLDEIKRAVSDFQDELQRIQSALTNRNMVEVISILEKGKRYRDRLD